MGRFCLSIEHTVTIISPVSSQEWIDYYDLRWRVLRQPWLQARGSEKDELEEEAYHCMATDEHKKVIGVGRIHKNSATEAQIRYMAVDEYHQRMGIGKLILNALENKARYWHINNLVLNARNDYVNFYVNNGYVLTDAGPVLYGTIHHSVMQKQLNPDCR